MTIFDGMDFIGPLDIDGNDVPESPGIYLICTGSSGGEKIIALYESDNMKDSIINNPKRDCWEKNRTDGNFTYNDEKLRSYYLLNNDESERQRIVKKIVERRPYKIVCYEPPRDDF